MIVETPADTSKLPFSYQVYGLGIEAWIPFSELAPRSPDDPADVIFRLGEVPSELSDRQDGGPHFQLAPGKLLICLEGVARFLAVGGQQIIVDPVAGASEDDIRLLLLCSPMGAVLLQRGLLPLHASAIATPQGAILFMGGSGEGKSTIASEFRNRGFRILADDIGVIAFDASGIPWVQPGYPQLKLWPDALTQIGEESGSLAKLRQQTEKRALPFPETFCSTPRPLSRIYVLETASSAGVELDPIPTLSRITLLLEHTYRVNFVPGLGLRESHFRQVAQLAAKIPIIRVARRKDDFVVAEVANRIIADLAL